jgi:hypothetical protein
MKKPEAKDSKVIFVKPYVYVSNQGDGSANVNFFNTSEEAEAYAEPDGERYGDDIFPVTLVIDKKTGKICNVRKRREGE